MLQFLFIDDREGDGCKEDVNKNQRYALRIMTMIVVKLLSKMKIIMTLMMLMV